MKKRFIVFLLAVCMTVLFIACGEAKAPVITDADSSPETVSSAFETEKEETASESIDKDGETQS